MIPKVYNFNKKIGQLGDIKFSIPDYFQWYTTGFESLISDDMLLITERYNNERSEVLAYKLLDNEHLSDTLIALNNDNYMWDSPYDSDMFEVSVDMVFKYIEKINKTKMNRHQNDKFQEISRDIVTLDDEELRYIIIPRKEYIQKISRIFKNYKTKRELK